jgi:hypothetical protein
VRGALVTSSARLAIALALLCLPAPCGAASPASAVGRAGSAAAPSLRLRASLSPERLGHGTTVGFTFEIGSGRQGVPPPLRGVDVWYPAGLGIALSGLGVATCSAETLEARGPSGCPANSLMGYGSALAEVPFGPGAQVETATITVVRAPTQGGHIALLFFVAGNNPVDFEVPFPGVLLPSRAPFGGRIHIDVPLIASLPGAPHVSVLRIRATLGPKQLTYYERVGGKLVPYHPPGILLPSRCPPGGFRFAARFRFLDGTTARASSAVPCPGRR